MAIRASGSPTAFWNNVAAGVGATSTAVELARDTQQVAFFITSSGATTITVECAHDGALNADGTTNDTNTSDWGSLMYLNTAVTYAFTGAGSISIIVPDFAARWVRLKTSAAVTLTAGYQASAS